MTIYHFLLFSIMMSLLLTCDQNTNPDQTSTSNRYKIAYNVWETPNTSDYEVYTMNLDGTGKKNITQDTQDVAWTYLAVKDKVLFISDRDTCYRCFFLYEMNPDGTGLKKVTDFLLRDSWMGQRKDGTELIVNPSPKVDSAFYIIDREGQLLQRLPTGLAYASDPVFSPDGEWIAFRGATTKSKRDEGHHDEIYLIKSDGTGLKPITSYPAADTLAPWYSYKAGPPRWHPTENFISYQSHQEGKYSLYAVSPDGNKQWKLTDNPMQEGWHDWSPDGKWLAVEVADLKETSFGIALMNWETKAVKMLTDTTYQYQQAPVFVLDARSPL